LSQADTPTGRGSGCGDRVGLEAGADLRQESEGGKKAGKGRKQDGKQISQPVAEAKRAKLSAEYGAEVEKMKEEANAVT